MRPSSTLLHVMDETRVAFRYLQCREKQRKTVKENLHAIFRLCEFVFVVVKLRLGFLK